MKMCRSGGGGIPSTTRINRRILILFILLVNKSKNKTFIAQKMLENLSNRLNHLHKTLEVILIRFPLLFGESKGAFHLSELAGRTITGPVIMTMKSAFSKGFC